MAIKKCRERGKYIGFCGQAPSDYPDFTRFLVQNNIEAVSLNPDSIIPMILAIAGRGEKIKLKSEHFIFTQRKDWEKDYIEIN